MTTYKLEWDKDWEILRISFGDPANNDQITIDAYVRVRITQK